MHKWSYKVQIISLNSSDKTSTDSLFIHILYQIELFIMLQNVLAFSFSNDCILRISFSSNIFEANVTKGSKIL